MLPRLTVPALLLLALPLQAAGPPTLPPGWPLPPGVRARFTPHFGGGAINCLAVSPKGDLVAAGRARGGTVGVWEVATGRVIGRLSAGGLTGQVTCLAFSPDGKHLAVGGSEPGKGVAFLYDLARINQSMRLVTHPGRTWALAFSPDGKWLATGGDEASVRLWDTRTGKPVREIRSDNQEHRTVTFSPDGKLLAAGGDGNDLTLWDPVTAEVVRDCQGLAGAVGFASFTRTGRQVIWVARQSTIRISDTQTAEEVAKYGSEKIVYNAFAIDPTGPVLATATSDGQVCLWDLLSSHQLGTALPSHPRSATALAISANGKVLVSGGEEGKVVVRDMPGLSDARRRLYWLLLASDLRHEVQLAEDGLCRKEALPFLRQQLEGFVRLRTEIPRLLQDLDADEFATRERATDRLTRLGAVSRAPLTRLLEGKPNLEVYRRAQRILNRLDGTIDEERCALRAVRIVEKIGSPVARKLLRSLLRTQADSLLGREIQAALKRLP